MTQNLALLELSPGAVVAIAVGYVVGGLICVAIAATGFGGIGGGMRALNAIIGIGCIGYAAYIMFGDSDTVFISWYIMILPVIMLIRVIVAAVQNRNRSNQPPQPAPYAPVPGAVPPGQYGQPGQQAAYGQPGQYPAQPGQPQQAAPYGQPARPGGQGATYGQAPSYGQAQPGTYGQPAAGATPAPARQAPPPPPPTERDTPLWPQQQSSPNDPTAPPAR